MATLDELRAEREKAERALSYIVAGLVRRNEPVEIAAAVAKAQEVTEVIAYTWVTVVEERFLASRKRIAIVANSSLGPGFAVFVVGMLLAFLSRRTGVGIGMTVVGAITTASAAVTLAASRRIAGRLTQRRMSTE